MLELMSTEDDSTPHQNCGNVYSDLETQNNKLCALLQRE